MPNEFTAVITGHLGKDPETRYVQVKGEERAVTKFTIAYQHFINKDKTKPTWFNCEIWQNAKELENRPPYSDLLSKGQVVTAYIDYPETREHDGKQYTSWKCKTVIQGASKAGQTTPKAPVTTSVELDDEIPF
jgi:hypothetical protein